MYHFSSRFSPYLTSYDFGNFFPWSRCWLTMSDFLFLISHGCALLEGWFPCWMFLVGFANTRCSQNAGWRVFGFGRCQFVLGQYILPLNILALIILMRLVLTPLAQVVFKSKGRLFYAFLLILILGLPLVSIEYSTFGILMVLFGFAVRHRGRNVSWFWSERIFPQEWFWSVWSGRLFLSIFFWIGWVLGMDWPWLVWVLSYFIFSAQEFIEFTQKFPKPAVWILQFCGRYSLKFTLSMW